MKDLNEHKKIAVLIDADNAQYSKIPLIMEELSSHGHLVMKRAYGDWSSENLKGWKKVLNEQAIQAVQQHAYTTGKNSTDVAMTIEAMDLLYTDRFDAFALISSDSDFTRLASRIRESEVFVFGIGEKKTPVSFRKACDVFLLTENMNEEKAEDTLPVNIPANLNADQVDAVKLLYRAWEQLQDEDGWANLGAAGSFLKRINPDFDPRTFKAKKLSDLVVSLASSFEVKKTPNGGVTSYKARQPENKVPEKRQRQRRKPSTA